MIYKATVSRAEDGNFWLTFPMEVVAKLGWKIGDELKWTQNEDKSWSIAKVTKED